MSTIRAHRVWLHRKRTEQGWRDEQRRAKDAGEPYWRTMTVDDAESLLTKGIEISGGVRFISHPS